MTQILTPYILAAILALVLLLRVERRPARVRVAAVGLWCSSVAIATLVMYAADWPGSADTWLNILWAGLIAASLVWCVVMLKQPAAAPAPTATLPPPGTMGTFVTPFEPEPDDNARGAHWVSPRPPVREAGPARQRYESRRRRIPIVARERRKHHV